MGTRGAIIAPLPPERGISRDGSLGYGFGCWASSWRKGSHGYEWQGFLSTWACVFFVGRRLGVNGSLGLRRARLPRAGSGVENLVLRRQCLVCVMYNTALPIGFVVRQAFHHRFHHARASAVPLNGASSPLPVDPFRHISIPLIYYI